MASQSHEVTPMALEDRMNPWSQWIISIVQWPITTDRMLTARRRVDGTGSALEGVRSASSPTLAVMRPSRRASGRGVKPARREPPAGPTARTRRPRGRSRPAHARGRAIGTRCPADRAASPSGPTGRRTPPNAIAMIPTPRARVLLRAPEEDRARRSPDTVAISPTTAPAARVPANGLGRAVPIAARPSPTATRPRARTRPRSRRSNATHGVARAREPPRRATRPRWPRRGPTAPTNRIRAVTSEVFPTAFATTAIARTISAARVARSPRSATIRISAPDTRNARLDTAFVGWPRKPETICSQSMEGWPEHGVGASRIRAARIDVRWMGGRGDQQERP